MLFKVDRKTLLQRLEIVCSPERVDGKPVPLSSPYLRIEANDDTLTLEGPLCENKFEANVQEAGVIFVIAEKFRDYVNGVTYASIVSVGASKKGWSLGKLNFPLEIGGVHFHPNPATAPREFPPPPVPKAKKVAKSKRGTKKE